MTVVLYNSHACHGGVTSWIQNHAAELKRLGIDVEIWFGAQFGSTRIGELERVATVRIGGTRHLLKQIDRGIYTVVHVVNSDPTAGLFPLARSPAKLVATSHGDLSDAWCATNCFAYTGVSADMALLNQPLTDLEVEVIPNGVDCRKFEPAAGCGAKSPPIVAWVGRSTDTRKDFPRFTRIAALLADRGVRFHVADGHAAAWANFAGCDCRHVNIERWERIGYAQMPAFFQEVAGSGGVLLMTSRVEGWGLVATEAAACGVTTVAPDVIGLKNSILPGTTGTLYPHQASDEAVADLVWEWILSRRTSPASVDDCATAAREHFAAALMSRRYLAIYERREQRLCRSRPLKWDAATPNLIELVGRLHDHQQARNEIFGNAARLLADEGETALAWRVLRRSFRRSLADLVRLRRVKPTVGTLLKDLGTTRRMLWKSTHSVAPIHGRTATETGRNAETKPADSG